MFVKRIVVGSVSAIYLFFVIKKLKLNKQLDDEQDDEVWKSIEGQDEQEDVQSGRESHSKLPNIDRFVGWWNNISLAYFSLTLVKYVIICSLDFDCLGDFRWLDCCLVGRLVITPRLAKHFKYMTCFMILLNLIWRSMMLKLGPSFKLDCLEFMLFERDEILAKELESVKTKMPTSGDDFLIRREETGNKFGSLIYIRIPFAHRSTKLLLRPSRSSRSLSHLMSLTLIYFALVLLAYAITCLLVFYIAAPMMMTKKGFALNYSNCVLWIESQPNSEDYSSIYNKHDNISLELAESEEFSLPMVDLSRLNLYQFYRFTMDAIDNTFIYLFVAVLFVVNNYYSILIVADMLIYSRQLSARLCNCIDTLRVASRTRSVYADAKSPINQRQEELIQVQALLMDYFSLMNRYNSYVSFYMTFCIAIWLAYSVGVCAWSLNSISSSNKTLEWYLIVLISTLFIIAALGSFAMVKMHSDRIYTLA